MKTASDEFEFTIRAKTTCSQLYSEVMRRIYMPDHGGRDRNSLGDLRAWLSSRLVSRVQFGLTLTLTKRTDADMAMAPVLRDVAVAVLRGNPGPTATKELLRLVGRLDNHMNIPVVDRLAGLASGRTRS